MSVLTEEVIRNMLKSHKLKEKDVLYLEPHQIVTPSARTYLMEKGITIKQQGEAVVIKNEPILKTDKQEVKKMSNEENKFETLFGAVLSEKPEHMTHLRGNVLVFKDHPRIALRGAIDSLESEIIMAQVVTDKQGFNQLTEDLEEILGFVRNMMKYEVTGEPVGEFRLQGLTASELREHSHHPSKYYGRGHFLPTYKHGEVVAYLNKLRTVTRETERVAYKAFCDPYGQVEREDIIQAFNRLSSLFWIMMFKFLAGHYKGSH